MANYIQKMLQLVPKQVEQADAFIKEHKELHAEGLKNTRAWFGTWFEYTVKDSGFSTEVQAHCMICDQKKWLEDPDFEP